MALDDILVTVTADISGYTQSLEQAAQATQQFQQNVQGSTGPIRQQESAMKSQGQAAQESGNEMKYVGDQYTAMGQAALGTASLMASAAAGIAIALGGAIMEAASFEDAFVGVEKTVGGTTQEMATISDEIRQMATEMPRSAVEIAGVAEEAGRLGIEADSISEFTKTMVMMGDASDMSASKAATSMARFMNIMGTSEQDVERLGSAITHMGNNTASTESEILDMSMRLAGASNQIGMSETDVVGLAASMSELGIRSEAGGTAMQKTLLTMNTAVMEGGEKLETFAKIAGMTGQEFKQTFEEDASEAVIAFIAGLNDINESGGDVSSTLADVGLNNERTMDTLLRLSSSHEELASNMDLSADAWDEGTALAEEAERVYGTLISRLKTLWNRVKEVVMIVGVPLLEAFSSILEILSPMMSGIEALAQAFDSLGSGTKKVMATIGLLTPLLIGIPAAVIAINGSLILMSGALATIETALAGLGLGLSALFGPAGWVAVGVAALAAGFIYLNGVVHETESAHQQLADEIDQVVESSSSAVEKTQESADAYAEEKSQVEDSISARSELAQKIMDLNSKEDKSVEDRSRLAAMTDRLSESNEGLNVSYDAQADSLNMSNETLKDKVDLLNEQERLASSQERMNELDEERNRLGAELEDINAKQKELNETTADNTWEKEKNNKASMELKQAKEEVQEAIEKNGEATERETQRMAEAQAKVDEAIQESVRTQTLAYEDLEGAQQEAADMMIETFGQMEDAATDMFEKMSTDSEQSVDEMIENLEHNVEAMEDWGENMEVLAEEGAWNLVEKFEEVGPEFAGELDEIVESGDGKIEELDELLAEGSDSAAESTVAPFRDELPEDVAEALEHMVQTGEMSLSEAMEAADFASYGEEVPDKVAQGIRYEDGEIKSATDDMINMSLLTPLQDAMDEADFEGEGSKAPEGVSTGITNGKGGLSETTKGMLTNDIMSPITNKLTDGTFSPYGQSVPDGTASGIRSNSHGPEASVSDMVDGTLTASTSGFGISGGSSSKFKSDGTATMTGLESGITSKHGSVIGALSNVTTDLVSTSDTGMSDVEGSFSGGVNLIDAAMSVLPGNVGGHMTSMLGSLQTGGSNQEGYMSGLADRLPNPFSGLGSVLSGYGSSAMQGLLNGLSSMTGSLMSKAADIAGGIKDKISGALKIKSPSRVMMDIGENVGKGLEIGMDSTISDLDKMAILMAKASTPVQPEVDTGMMNRNRTKAQQAVSGKMAIKSAFERSGMDKSQDKQRQALEQTMMRALQSQPDTVINMDSEEVGRLTRPHINKGNALDNIGRRFP